MNKIVSLHETKCEQAEIEIRTKLEETSKIAADANMSLAWYIGIIETFKLRALNAGREE